MLRMRCSGISRSRAGMSDLAIAVIAGFNWLKHCAGLAGADRKIFSGDAQSLPKGCDGGREMVGNGRRQGALRATVAGAAGAAAVPVSGLGGLWPTCERNRRGAQNNVARMERSEIRDTLWADGPPRIALRSIRATEFLILLRVEQRHGGIHHHLDQAGAVMRKPVAECARELG